MTLLIQLMLIVLAVSLDGFTVGLTYGLKKISITITTLLIIISCSGLVVFSSMTFGKIISKFISPQLASNLGGLILICLGLFLIISLVRSHIQKAQTINQSYSAIIHDPLIVDKDKSGSISANEAFVLGIALALDAFGAGIGAAMIGYPTIITTFLIALASGFFVFSGFKLGHLFAKLTFINNFTYFPPLLLIFIGISSILK